MGKALYRKYRPISLSTVVGQDSVIKPLSEAIKSGNEDEAERLAHLHMINAYQNMVEKGLVSTEE